MNVRECSWVVLILAFQFLQRTRCWSEVTGSDKLCDVMQYVNHQGYAR